MSGKSDLTAASRLFGAMSGIRGVWLDEAEETFENGAPETGESGFKRFLHSGWGTAAACLVTAVCVWVAMMVVGRLTGPGNTPVDPPAGQVDTENQEETGKPRLSPETLMLPTMEVLGAHNSTAALHAYAASFMGSSQETDTDGNRLGMGINMDVMFPPDPDWLPMVGVTGQGSDSVTMTFPRENPPSSLTVQVLKINGKEVKSGFTLTDVSEQYRASMNRTTDERDRQWKLTFHTTFREMRIVLITARWTEWDMSGSITYAYLLLPEQMTDPGNLPTDRGLTVFVYQTDRPDVNKCILVPDKNASDYLTVVSSYYNDAGMYEMKDILAKYKLPPEDISVVLFDSGDFLRQGVTWEPTYDEDVAEEEKAAKREAHFAALEESVRSELGIPLTK